MLHQRLHRVCLCQRHIAREHHHNAIVRQNRRCLLHGVARSQLRHLAREPASGFDAVGLRQGSFHLLRAVARNHHHLPRLQLRGGIEHMLHQRLVCQFLQHLGHGAFHARAFAGGHDDDVEWLLHSVCPVLAAAAYPQDLI